MLYDAARQEARAISSASLAVPMPPAAWEETRETRRAQWLEMLGLSPLPERAPIEATITGTLDRGDYVVDKIHFQPVPGAFVTGNIYRPAETQGKLPAVLYLCGHTKGKVNAPYQANPRWFGQHGYVALVLDPIQLGECQGFHAGTYSGKNWDWISRGYTPAGTEVWIAMRALDYLQERADVDPESLGVTGLSGGGVISWCLGAADERVRCVVPVCQTGTIEHVITDRATDGHCDCAFFINYYRWCQPDIGALIAPRPLLVAAGTEDILWRPYAFRDACHRIKHQYAALGAADKMDLVEDLTPHGYTPKLRKAIFEWFNRHLKGDNSPVTDDVTDFVEPEENLLVFGGKLPENDRMKEIDRILVSRETVALPESEAGWLAHRETALAKLRSVTFRHVPEVLTPRVLEFRSDGAERSRTEPGVGTAYGSWTFETRDGLSLSLRTALPENADWPVPLVAYALQQDAKSGFCGGGSSRPGVPRGVGTVGVEVRNTAATSVGPGYLWTLRRVYPLLGQTLPERQVSDLLAGIALMRAQALAGEVCLFGQGHTAALAIYAAVLDESIREVILAGPPESHEDPQAPEFLGILRFGDLPQNLALVYPRPITFIGEIPPAYQWTVDCYARLGAADRIRVLENVGNWSPAG